MTEPSRPIRLEPLISLTRDATADPRARARAFRIALSFPRTQQVNDELAEAFPTLLASQQDDEEVVGLLHDAIELPRPQVAEAVGRLVTSDRPAVEAAAKRAAATLAGAPGPGEDGHDPFTALLDQALASGEPDDARTLARVVQPHPLDADRLDALERRALEGDDGDEATLWFAVAAARQGRVDALVGFADGSRDGPAFTWGQPERAYATIAAMRPLPPPVLVDILGALGITDPLDPDEVARGNLVTWALTGISDPWGTPVVGVEEEEPGGGDPTIDISDIPWADDEDPESVRTLVTDLLREAEAAGQDEPDGPARTKLGNALMKRALELPPCQDPDLGRVICDRIGSSLILDNGQLAALAYHLADLDVVLEMAAADVLDPDAEAFLKALGEEAAGLAPSPYRGSGGGETRGDPDMVRRLADLMTSGAPPPDLARPPDLATPAPGPASELPADATLREEEAVEEEPWEADEPAEEAEEEDWESAEEAFAGEGDVTEDEGGRGEGSMAGGAGAEESDYDDALFDRGYGYIESDSDVELPELSELVADSDRISLDSEDAEPQEPPDATMETLTRTPHMDVLGDGPFHPGEHIDLRVYADREAARPTEAVATIRIDAPASQEEFPLSVTLVTSAHLQVIGERTRSLVLRRSEARSPSIHFAVAVRSPDELRAARAERASALAGVMAVFTYKTRPSGSVARSLSIAWPEEPDSTATTRDDVSATDEATGDGEPPEGIPSALDVDTTAMESDLQVTLMHVPGDPPGQFQCTVASPHVDLGLEPETWYSGDGRAVIDEVLARFIDAPPERRSDELMGAGYEFFDAAPESFKTYFWHLVDHVPGFQTISIVTNEDTLPWELMVPTRDDPGPDDPSDPLGVTFDIGRWTSTTLKAAPQRIPLGTGLVVAPRYDKDDLQWSAEEAELVSGLGTHLVTPATAPALEEALRSGEGGLFHFVGHGHAEGAFHELSLEGERVAHTVLRHWLRSSGYLRHRPTLVVLNACEVGRPLPSVLGGGGIPAVFIREGAAAVLAPTWSVKDSVARDVAERFYTVLTEAPQTPIAHILRDIRRLSYHRGDDVEDSYAAYCFYGDPNARVELSGTRSTPS